MIDSKSVSKMLSRDELDRYNRQIIIDGIGIEGQEKLKKAKVLVVGAGGLGSPVLLYLAGAGIGTIGIVDADDVSCSNLQRQIIHTSGNEGINKTISAKEMINKLNSNVNVEVYPYFLNEKNARELFNSYDFIIDAVDNFETKFLINDVCVKMEKPFCYAGVLAFYGQVMTYVPGDYPCFRCLFEEVPEQESVPTSLEVGIIGAIAGVIGSIQAMEAIKYFTNMGELLTGRMFIMDGLSMETKIVKIKSKNKYCKACSK